MDLFPLVEPDKETNAVPYEPRDIEDGQGLTHVVTMNN